MQDPYAFEKKQRRKIIIMSIVMIFAIVVLVIWGVIAFNNKNQVKDNTQPIVATEDSLPSDSATSHSSASSSSSLHSTSTAQSSTSSSNLPQSGPADHLPTFLLILAAIALFSANKKFKSML